MRRFPAVLLAALLTETTPQAAHALTTPITPAATRTRLTGTRVTRARAASALRVARIFADGMVLQRRQPIVVWGWANAGTRVTVALGARTVVVRATPHGAWRATLPAHEAGGPHSLRISADDARIELHDVLIGDVWLASGQSNMEWPLSRDLLAAQTIAEARDTQIRQFKIPTGYAYAPQDSLVAGTWTAADQAHAGDFSAVAYYFARALRRTSPVPIGIINSTWGGSNIESWIRREAQGLNDEAWRALRAAQDRARDSVQRALRTRLGGLPTVDSGLVGDRAAWADVALDDRAWTSMPVPGYWEGVGFPGMDGIAWYRTRFSLTAAEAAAGVTLAIEALDDDDISWVNGREIGRTNGYNVARRYAMPPSALHAGENVLAVRVSDGAGGGGINGRTELILADGTRRSLAGDWRFKVGRVSFQPDGQVINKVPSVLYNQMMHPIVSFPIAGVLWYQGESNANNNEQARAYRAQFHTLITSWRAERGARGASLPFLWVQLPNFGAPDASPPALAGWALQREAMEAALALPRTGRAIAIDLGESNDIHPRNKRDVGERLALVARRVAYGERIASESPMYRSHTAIGDTLVVTFAHAGAALRTTSQDRRINGFAVAGADGAWSWAQARIDGSRVRVWSERVQRPTAVRYAWSNGPVDLTLVGATGLPVAPFRTDRW